METPPPRSSADSLASQSYWDQGYEKLALAVAPPEDLVRIWLARHVQAGSGACLELGCFPGRYLAVFGELGYELHGLDLTPRVETDLKSWLKRSGYRVGNIVRGDVWAHEFKRSFDVVSSFGLIEHFDDWPELLRRHAQLVAPGGRLVVSVPNFKGACQYWLHRWLDAENLARHNVQAMSPESWASVIEPLGFKMAFCGYFGHFDFWAGESGQRKSSQKLALRGIRQVIPWWQKLPDAGAYSPYAGLVAARE
jgi:SAM-dependent methyltransferase